ncbi:MAG: DUF2851 family protein [Terrimicrobiaceae bacterium]
MNRGASLLENYLEAKASHLSRIKEPSPSPHAVIGGELELQARFYAGEFGLTWRGIDGEQIEALHLGEWNREPGPDFVGAALRVDGKEMRGDIEIDREDLDWERHGHATNPAFDNVVVHAFFRPSKNRFFTRTSKHQMVPQVCLTLETAAGAKKAKGAASRVDPGELDDVLESAVRYRLAVKRERWFRAEALHGTTEALFQAVAMALGYKNNKVPFLLVAQRVRWERARTPEGEALLFGIAGFLGAEHFDAAGSDSREYARGLWNTWWAVRAREERLMLPQDSWNFSASRPSNHPHRRLGALAAIATNLPALEDVIHGKSSKAFLEFFARLSHPFWQDHASLSGVPLQRSCALVGRDRATEMTANLFAPLQEWEESLKVLSSLKCINVSSKVKRAIRWLGVDAAHAKTLMATARGQQALLQLYEDFFPALPEDFFPEIRRSG